ncbi:MAG: di-trans,poly-cis-decaprenylcistransferase [Candidatus Wildermuthbacteria bacterium RIFCSPHIGHO2_02_FULL_49_9]|uniref:Isoprenyl transferase n=2 Tax=Candidatus Wildermuthiibacteriota TaxID=1817923 RepID=A0A1G2QWB8_9BACT|nr:MAG: di-trans,poly-cis-decaprenylcistransferase [Candidatus Wildermuthbacteria bacterium RIFCSPHIGHO2_01_FULL_49_22b]OHA70168.1 MAG: di-trans,poly-cis-decaprenylcistransferase [Candidatus Wildermuthbacteria bacterium RIFCSPHIGHO2_02_FULL_49_9]
MTEIQNSKIPQHIVLFPDGNRRWARELGLDTLEGHKAGYENLVRLVDWCQARGVKALTAFGFSTENWNRAEREVAYLMRLLETGLLEHLKKYGAGKAKERGVRIKIIGQKERLPESLQKVIAKVEEATMSNDKFFLTLGISYGGRWDIVQAAQKIMKEGLGPEELSEEEFARHLSTAGLPDPDLVIRAGGEQRFSNFLLWQSAYAELYFYKKYWPEFKEQDLDEAIAEYQRRQRRFGR